MAEPDLPDIWEITLARHPARHRIVRNGEVWAHVRSCTVQADSGKPVLMTLEFYPTEVHVITTGDQCVIRRDDDPGDTDG